MNKNSHGHANVAISRSVRAHAAPPPRAAFASTSAFASSAASETAASASPTSTSPSASASTSAFASSAASEPIYIHANNPTPPVQWRGVMLDSARTCYSVDTIVELLQLFARYGFNRFQWHLNDDAGWRFEVPEYSKLTQVGAFLARDSFEAYSNLYADTRERAIEQAPAVWANGYYDDADIARVVSVATSLGIQVVPEVDLPSHMMAAIAAYPQLGRPQGVPLPKGSMREHMWWPARNDLLWPSSASEHFVRAIVRRIMELFPQSPIIHIGGDECAYQQWTSDPGIGRIMARYDVSDPRRLQKWFFDIACEELHAGGRHAGAWDEVCNVSDDPRTLIFAWDEERAEERIRNVRNDFVYADARYFYLNRIDPDGSHHQKGMLPGISIHDILGATWNIVKDKRCIGVQAGLWSEFMLCREDLLMMAFPRLIAIAERLWNLSGNTPHHGRGCFGSNNSEPDSVAIAAAKSRITQEYAWLQDHLRTSTFTKTPASVVS